MKKYYLVDYENVNSKGLEGIGTLSEEDQLIIFYTKNAGKIEFAYISIFKELKAELVLMEVASGKQALDLQLVSYLGYLIGKNGHDAEYVIISKDTGFLKVQGFWEEYAIDVRKSLLAADPKEKEEEEAKKQVNRALDKTKVNTGVQKELSTKGFENEVVNSVASIVSNNLFKDRGKQLVYREIIKKYGQKKGLQIYTVIKNVIK